MNTISIDIEKQILSAVLQSETALLTCMENIDGQDFKMIQHQLIYNAIIDVYRDGGGLDISLIYSRINEVNSEISVLYLSSLYDVFAITSNIKTYIAKFQSELIKRKVEALSRSMLNSIEDGITGESLLTELSSGLIAITEGSKEKTKPDVESIYYEIVDDWKKIERGEKVCIPVNEMVTTSGILGWYPGHLITIGGYCLGKGTNVICYSGKTKKVEDIKIGDLLSPVWSKTPRKVLGITKGVDELYEISGKYINTFTVNSSHILPMICINNKRGKIYYFRAGEFAKKTKAAQSIYRLLKVSAEYKKQRTLFDIPPYLLGLWLGDGTKNKPEITVHEKEIEIINYLRQYCSESGYPFKLTEDKRHKGVYKASFAIKERGDISHRKHAFINRLRKVGVYENKCIPNKYLYASIEDRLSLLAGLIDTDGSLSGGSGTCYSFYQTDIKLMQQVQYLSESLGFNTDLRQKSQSHSNKFNGNHIWRLNISGANLYKIPIRCERKRIKKMSKKNQLGITFNIESKGRGEYYGFELDGNHLFLTENFIVNHNTSVGKSTYLAQIVVDACIEGASVMVFSLEDKRTDKFIKVLANITDIPQGKLMSGDFNRDIVQSAWLKIKDYKLLIYDDIYSVEEIALKILKAKMTGNVDIVCIDFIQNITSEGGIYERMSNAIIELQKMAKRFGVTMIVLSQVSNESMRGDSEIIGLKGAGELASASDIVMWLKRVKGEGNEHKLELEIRKNRPFGETGIRRLRFSDRWTRIERG